MNTGESESWIVSAIVDTVGEKVGIRKGYAAPRAEACGLRGLDGAQWLVETVDDRGYRFDKEWSPNDGDIRRVGLALLGLTGWKIDPVY